jgi:hypothetical protein
VNFQESPCIQHLSIIHTTSPVTKIIAPALPHCPLPSPPAAAAPPLPPLLLLSSAASACRAVAAGGTAKNAPPLLVSGNVYAVLPAPDNSPTAAVELSCRRSPATSAIRLTLLCRRLLLLTSAVLACVLPAPPLITCVLCTCAAILVVLRGVCLQNSHGGRHCKERPAAAGGWQRQRHPPHHRQWADNDGQIIAPPHPRNANGRIITPPLPCNVNNWVVPPPPAPPPVNVRGPVLALPPLVACVGLQWQSNYCAAAPLQSP